jgi:hypothetical protein
MTLSFVFPSGWYIQLLIIFATYLILFFIRKSHKRKNNFKNQIIFSLAFSLLCLVGELIGISLKLWTYFPTNWPITVWIGYLGIGLFAYQLVRLLDELIKDK